MPDLSIAPLQHAPALRDQVYATLEDLIVRGELLPGARLAEAELAEQLGVSRNPVREALTVLAHAGWVDLRPRQGALVHEPSAKERDDFLAVRTLVKQGAARLAAQSADDEDVAAMRGLVERGTAAARAGDLATAADLNSRFHETLDASAHNLALAEVLSLMKKRLRWYFAPIARSRGLESWSELAAITDAIAAHDPDAAAAAMQDHCERTAEAYRASMTAHA